MGQRCSSCGASKPAEPPLEQSVEVDSGARGPEKGAAEEATAGGEPEPEPEPQEVGAQIGQEYIAQADASVEAATAKGEPGSDDLGKAIGEQYLAMQQSQPPAAKPGARRLPPGRAPPGHAPSSSSDSSDEDAVEMLAAASMRGVTMDGDAAARFAAAVSAKGPGGSPLDSPVRQLPPGARPPPQATNEASSTDSESEEETQQIMGTQRREDLPLKARSIVELTKPADGSGLGMDIVIQPDDQGQRAYPGRPDGCYVRSFKPNSVAEAGGMRAGVRIRQINDRPTAGLGDIVEELTSIEPGGEAVFFVGD